MEHIDDHNLERYYLGMVHGRETIQIEKHLFWCEECVKRAYEAQDYVDAIRAAIIKGDFDLDWLERNAARESKRRR